MTKVVGLISGTSVDGIDAALVEIDGRGLELEVELLAGETYPYPDDLRAEILAVCEGKPLSMEALAALDDAIARQFARAAQNIQRGRSPAQLIGSHGQTVFHRPPTTEKNEGKEAMGYSLQLGRGEMMAEQTGLPVVSNFRAADIAAGGQGAPLVSRIDACLLAHPRESRCVQNLGGIGNVTYLPPRRGDNWEAQICGWDTGPSNVLLDLAVGQLTDGRQSYDRDGEWAAQGKPCQELIDRWLQQDFFQQPPPKSTGRELFSAGYLHQCEEEAMPYQLSAADWLATLSELTVVSIVQSYRQFLPQMPNRVLLCGGGSRNSYLKKRLATQLESTVVTTTDAVGLSSDFKEAIAFAVLAYWRQEGSGGNVPQVTGARQLQPLGTIHLPVP